MRMESRESNRFFHHVMKEEWEKVIEMYGQNANSDGKKNWTKELTKLKDTALHVAVLHGQPWVASSMVNKIPPHEVPNILSLKNDLGDTPLHLAAFRGDAELCRQMRNAVSSNDFEQLIGNRNKKNETPLFVSVLYGNTEAYRILRPWKTKEQARKYLALCRSYDGNTILHSAIDGEHFRLAWEIIIEFPQLIPKTNADGHTPLHVLATKSNAFRSGKRHGPFDAILYQYISVDENKLTRDVDEANMKKKTIKYPENYITCVNIFRPFWKLIKYASNKLGISTDHGVQTIVEEDVQIVVAGQEEDMIDEDKDEEEEEEENHFLPPNWTTFSFLIGVLVKIFLIILGIGFHKLKKMQEKKAKHKWAVLIMKKLTNDPSAYINSGSGQTRETSTGELGDDDEMLGENPPGEGNTNKEKEEGKTNKEKEEGKKQVDQRKDETALLIAAKNGVSEIVKAILNKYPVAIHDVDQSGKNVLLLAVEHRQTHVFEYLKKESKFKDDARFLGHTDNDHNTAWHLAAKSAERRPWLIAGEAMQLQWEYKWFKYVRQSMPKQFAIHNRMGDTPAQIFRDTHEKSVTTGNEWLTKTSESCSVVAALIAGVAFATSVTVPGGNNESTGKPVLEGQAAFNIFSIASLVSLCFSLTALVFFLAILTSRSEEKDFHKSVPRKLLFGMSSLFISIAAMLTTFCSGHFFLIQDRFAYAALPIYFVTCLPLTFFAFSQLRLYFDLVYAIVTKVPLRSYNVLPL